MESAAKKQEKDIDANEEYFLEISEEELASIDFSHEDLSDKSGNYKDVIHQYLEDLKWIKPLTKEEQRTLPREVLLGNEEAKKRFIEGNLRLVFTAVKNFLKKSNAVKFEDAVQEGNLALIGAVENYDVSRGFKFSSYAYKYIYGKLQNLAIKSCSVHVPRDIKHQHQKYQKYSIKFYKENGRYPTKEEYLEYCNISESTYNNIICIEKNVKNVVSLNNVLSDDNNETTLQDFVPNSTDSYLDFEESISQKEFQYEVKQILTPSEYYIIYNRYFLPEPLDFRTMAPTLGVSFQRVQQIEASAMKKIKEKLFEKERDILTDHKLLYKIDLAPTSLETLILLTRLKNSLNDYDYYLFYHLWFKKEKVEDIAKKVKKSTKKVFEEYKKVVHANAGIICDEAYINEELEKLKREKQIIKLMNSEPSLEPLYLKKQLFRHLNKNDIQVIMNECSLHFTKKEHDYAKMFFEQPSFTKVSQSEFDKVVQAIELYEAGYTKSKYVPNKLLYKLMLENKESIDPKLYEYIMSAELYQFSGYPYQKSTSSMWEKTFNLFTRLELKYYGLENMFDKVVPLDIAKSILENPKYNFSLETQEILKLGLGINCEPMLLKDILKKYKKSSDYFSRHYQRLYDIYIGLDNKYDTTSESKYIRFINDARYKLTENERKVAYAYYVEHKSYEQLLKDLNIKDDNRMFLSQATAKCEAWYYGIIDFQIFNESGIYAYFKQNQDKYTEIEKTIIINRYIKGLTSKENAALMGIEESAILPITARFNREFIKYNANNIYYNHNELYRKTAEDQVLCPITDSVLNHCERHIVSLLHGIKSSYNPEGKIHTREAIQKRFNLSSNESYEAIREIRRKIGGCACGLIKCAYPDVTYEEVKKGLEDKRCPLTSFEKEILSSVKGVKTEVINLSELMKIHSISKDKMLNIYKKAIIKLKKYLYYGVGALIDYEEDVLPNLKYFPAVDQTILKQFYKDKKDVQSIATSLSVEIPAMEKHLLDCKRKLYYYLKNPNAKRFDYDKAREIIIREDIPFYGKKDIALYAYNRLLGDDGKFPASSLDIKEKKIEFKIKMLMLAVLKYQDGIRKNYSLSLEELEEFYLNHGDKYKKTNKSIIEKSLNTLREDPNTECTNSFLIFEMLKQNNRLPIPVSSLTKEEIIEIVKNNPYGLSKPQLDILCNYYKILPRDLMNEEEIRCLIDVIYPFAEHYLSKKKEKEQLDGKEDAKLIDIADDSCIKASINTVEMTSLIREIPSENSEILFTTPIVDLVYAYMQYKHYKFDILTMDKIYDYIFKLHQQLISEKEQKDLQRFFTQEIDFKEIMSLYNLSERDIAFWKSFLMKKENQVLFKEEIPMRHLEKSVSLMNNNKYPYIKKNFAQLQLDFCDDIPDKYYSHINTGDELDGLTVYEAKELLKEYERHLVKNGSIMCYFKNYDDKVEEIFDGMSHKIMQVKPVQYGAVKRDLIRGFDTIVLAKKYNR